jgi:hypothetical protein
MGVFSATFIAARIAFYEALIANIETVITGLSLGTQKSYTINTGQTVTSVTKQDLADLQSLLETSITALERWTIAQDGGGNTQVVPG